ncbi:MAG: hypothetical protein PHF60_01770 [Candidatus ainarchaeum sp.]|nr:hypothetical protein [Candidatus ainarchaeum sp.]
MKREYIYLSAGLALSAMLYGIFHFFSGTDYFGSLVDILTVLVALLATIGLFRAYRSLKKDGSEDAEIFFFFTISELFWLIAEVVWAFYEIILQIEAPLPSFADVFWVAGYLPFIYGLYLAFDYIEFHRKAAIVAVVIYLAASAFTIPLLRDNLMHGEGGILANVTYTGYIMADTIMFALSIPVLVAFFAKPIGRAWLLIGLSTSVVAIADIWFFQLNASGQYTSDHIVNYLYMLDYVWIFIGSILYLEEKKEK